MSKIFCFLLLIGSVLSQSNLYPSSRCLGNCAGCANDNLASCSGRQYIQCAKGYDGQGCRIKDNYLEELVLMDSTKPQISHKGWQYNSTFVCQYKNNKKQNIKIHTLGIYSQFQTNQVTFSVQPWYQNFIMNFNLIRTSWAPFSDLLRVCYEDQEQNLLNQFFIQYQRREQINLQINKLRCRKDQPFLVQKFQFQGKFEPNQKKMIIKFQGLMFSQSQWAISNVVVGIGCSKFLVFDGVECQKCSKGFYPVKDKQENIERCSICGINCQQCNGPEQCTRCNKQYSLQKGKCITKNKNMLYPPTENYLACSGYKIQISKQTKKLMNIKAQQIIIPLTQQTKHTKLKLSMNLFYSKSKEISKGLVHIYIDQKLQYQLMGSQISRQSENEKYPVDRCKGFGTNQVLSVYKVSTNFVKHNNNNANIRIQALGIDKIGIQGLYVEYQYDQEQDKLNNKPAENEQKPTDKQKQKVLDKPDNKTQDKSPAKQQNKPLTQPQKNTQIKPDYNKTQNKPQNKTQNSPQAKPQVKPQNKPQVKPQDKTQNKPQNKTQNSPEPKTQNNSETKPFNKNQSLVQVKPQNKSQVKPQNKTQPKSQLNAEDNTQKPKNQDNTNIRENAQKKRPALQQQIKPSKEQQTQKPINKPQQSNTSKDLINNNTSKDQKGKQSNNNMTNNSDASSIDQNSEDSPNGIQNKSYLIQVSQTIRLISNIKQNIKLGIKQSKQFIITIIYPIQLQYQYFPYLTGYFANINRTLIPVIIKQTDHYQQLAFNLNQSLLNQTVTISMFSKKPINYDNLLSRPSSRASRNRNLQQNLDNLQLGQLKVIRYDYLNEQQWVSIQRYSILFQVMAWLAIISTIVLTFIGNSVITQKFSSLLQMVFLHVYIYSEYLPVNFKQTISGLQRIQNLDYFLSNDSFSNYIENSLLGSIIQFSPTRFTMYNKDINFTRAIYPCIIINIIYFIWYVTLCLVKWKIQPGFVLSNDYQNCSRINKLKFHIIRTAERPLNFWHQVWQYQYIAFIWAASMQVYNFKYPENSIINYVSNVVLFAVCTIIVIVLPIFTFLYLNKRYFRLDYFEYSYWYNNIFFLNIPEENLPSRHHRILILAKNFRYLLFVICVAFLGNNPIPALIIIMLNHLLSLLYTKFARLQIKKFNQILNIVQYSLFILLAIIMLVAFQTSKTLSKGSYLIIGHVLTTICLLLTLTGLIRAAYYLYHKLHDEIQDNQLNNFHPPLQTIKTL